MTTGKGKMERYARIYVGGYDLSGDARTFSGLDNKVDAVDFTGWSNAVRQFLGNMRMVGVRGFQAFANDVTGGAFAVLKDSDVDAALSILFGSNAAPAAGNTAYLLDSIQIGSDSTFEGGAGVIQGDFLIDAAGGSGGSNPLGYVLLPSTSLSSTTNGTTVDTESGSTTVGYSANIHIIATSSGDYAFKIQDSTNGSSWADLASFSIDGSAIASEHISSVTAQVDRYVRFVATKTAGTVTAICTFARNGYTATS